MIYEVLYYIFILAFGAYSSLRIGLGSLRKRDLRLLCLLYPCLLLLQGLSMGLWSMDTVWLLYPFITHLPLVLILALRRKIRIDAALSAVLISYSLCQLPRWIGLVVNGFEMNDAAAFVIHLSMSILMLAVLDRYCLGSIHDAIAGMRCPILNMGVLPLVYYLYEYFVVYTNRRYVHVEAFSELISTAMVLFFVLFVVTYQRESEKRRQIQQQAEVLEMELSQAGREISMLRTLQEQTAIHRHDLRHHMNMIHSLMSTDKKQQAEEYIRRVESEIQDITPMRCCENELINLLMGSFRVRAQAQGIALNVKMSIPEKLNLPETELCALLSNGFENAMHAVSRLKENKSIDFYCDLKQNKLLIQIQNPYAGKICMKNGLPVPPDDKPHYGCRSIQSIALRRRGICSFEAKDGVFTLRVAIPIEIIKET